MTSTPLWDSLSPLIANILALLITAFIGWVANIARVKFNIEIEANQRSALHSAIMTGINAALAAFGGRVAKLTPNAKIDIVALAVEYANTSVPDAVKALKATPEIMKTLATAKLTAVGTEQQATPVVDVSADKTIPLAARQGN